MDDTEERLRWFRKRCPGMREATTAAAAIEILAKETFDLVFLDHDLSWADAGFPDKQFGNGKEVARYLAITKFAGRVVIHSKNELGVEAMRKVLPHATIARYESFEIELTAPSPRAAAAAR